MKKTKFSSLLSSPFPLSHNLRKLSVEFQIVIPNTKPKDSYKRKLGQEDLGWDQPILQEASPTHTKKEAEYTVEACSASIFPLHRLCFTVYVQYDLDRETVIFINFLKISLSNVVSRTNCLP